MSRFVFSFLMAPLCGTQVLWLMNNQEPFMVLCVCFSKVLVQCKDEEAVVVEVGSVAAGLSPIQ